MKKIHKPQIAVKILFMLISMNSSLYAMDMSENENIFGKLENEFHDIRESSAKAEDLRLQSKLSQIRQINHQIDHEQNPEIRKALINERTELKKDDAQERKQLLKNGRFYFKEREALTQAQLAVTVNRLKHENTKELTTITAQNQRDGLAQGIANAGKEMIIQMLARPDKAALFCGLAAAGYYTAQFSLKILATLLEKHIYLPKLAYVNDTSLLSPYERFVRWIKDIKASSDSLDDIIFYHELQEQVASFAQNLQNIVKHKSLLNNILLYGPPGTGKTKLAKTWAINSNCEYIYFTPADLKRFNSKDGLEELNKLFDPLAQGKKPLMIILDECEKIFTQRDTSTISEENYDYITILLKNMSTAQSHVFVVGITNRYETFDVAAKSRFAEKIYVGAPGPIERRKILNKYINDYIYNNKYIKHNDFYINLAEEVFNEAHKEEISQKLDKLHNVLTGRHIEQLVILWINAASSLDTIFLDKEHINMLTDKYIKQEIESLQ